MNVNSHNMAHPKFFHNLVDPRHLYIEAKTHVKTEFAKKRKKRTKDDHNDNEDNDGNNNTNDDNYDNNDKADARQVAVLI